MSLGKKYSYIRALIVGIPLGIGCLVVGLNQFISTPKTDSQLIKETGIIIDYGEKTIYDREADAHFEVFFIKINTNQSYFAEFGKHIDYLSVYFSTKNMEQREVMIWHEMDKNYIKQMMVDGHYLIKYKPPYWIAHFFFLLGLITTLSAVIYVVKHPEDYTGKKK